jgi:ribosomal protein S18 acetylase RimI-like enzyme
MKMEKDKIQFLIAEDKNSQVITDLVNSVYRGENSKKGWTTEADFLSGIRITEEKVKEIINRNKDLIILVVFEEKIIGCVHLENTGSYSYLGMLSVDVNYQDRGIGKLLINECERYTKEIFGHSEIRMKVISRRTELIEYYNRRGYFKSDEIEEFGANGDTFGDTKEMLYFVTLTKSL